MSAEPLTIPLTVHPKAYIERWQKRGIPVEKIAEMMGLSVRMIFHMKKKDCEPRWSIALRMVELDLIHCSTASAMPATGFDNVQ